MKAKLFCVFNQLPLIHVGVEHDAELHDVLLPLTGKFRDILDVAPLVSLIFFVFSLMVCFGVVEKHQVAKDRYFATGKIA